MSLGSSLSQRLALHPLRAAAVVVALFFVALLASVLRQPSVSAAEMSANTWYGDAFNARGFEKRTLGRAIVLPTREVGAQRAPAIATVEGLSVPSAQFPAAEIVVTERDLGHRVALIWRNSIEPATTQRMELAPGTDRDELVRLASHPGWKGTISGIGVAAGHGASIPLSLMSVRLLPQSASTTWAMLTSGTQIALARPNPGQESVARALRVWPLAWLAAAMVAGLALVAFIGRRFIGEKSAATFLLIAASVVVLSTEAVRAGVNAISHADDGDLTRAETLRAINGAMVSDATNPNQKSAALHVWSADGRGHEIALAAAPRKTWVRLGADPLPPAATFAANDVVGVLARRGVRYVPASASLEWDVEKVPQRVRVDVIYAGAGDAVFRVKP